MSKTHVCAKCGTANLVTIRICPKCGHRDFVDSVSIPATPIPVTAVTAAASAASKPSARTTRPANALANTQARILKPWAVTVLVGAVALIGLSFVKTGESMADWAASRTSVATERQNADEFIAESELARAFASEDDPAQRMTNSMGQRLVAALAPASRYQYRFRVVNSNEVNAFALPGGDIVVHKGLFRIMTRPEQLAAVLAHEIQHVERQHGLRSSYRAMSLGAILVWTFGITTDGGVEMVHSLKQNKYARSLETEADIEGAELLMRAGINRQHMVDMLNLLAKQHPTKVPAWLSDHPDPAARAVRVASGR